MLEGQHYNVCYTQCFQITFLLVFQASRLPLVRAEESCQSLLCKTLPLTGSRANSTNWKRNLSSGRKGYKMSAEANIQSALGRDRLGGIPKPGLNWMGQGSAHNGLGLQTRD